METISKTAVVLFNLGGPDRPESIRPFLYNFFMDPNIVRLPLVLRWLLAQFISRRRSKREAGSSYGLLGGRSPLLENTQAQARALEAVLGAGFKVFVCMRYWHPMAGEVVRQVKDYNPDKIVLIPLYPQYSTTTTRSAFQTWDRAAQKVGLDVSTARLCCYPRAPGFIDTSIALIRPVYNNIRDRAVAQGWPMPRLLLSAHGLPESIIRDGDPYQWQGEETARAITEALNIPDLDWIVCYQSRVGRQKWIGPSTEEELERAGRAGVPVVIYPHSFVNEHVETLVELDIEYRHKAEEFGVPAYGRVSTVGIQPGFIEELAKQAVSGQHQNGFYNVKSTTCCKITMPRCPHG